ncbi:MAG: ABC transporter ATP-binding protein [Acidobacteria bacterium]|nr:ABC transporter ATP-binding protein [Acidobacteriota bacterium]
MAPKYLDINLLRRLLRYVRRHLMLAVVVLVFMLGFNLLSVLQPYLIKVGIDEHVANQDLNGLQHIVLLLGGILLGAFVCQFLFSVLVQWLGQKLLFDLRLDLLQKVLDLSSDYFDRTAVGKILTNVTNDVEAIREFISEGIVTVIAELLKVVIISAAMFLLNYRLALLAFITIPLFVLATALFRRSIRTGFRGVRKANAEINTTLNETITGIREIKLFNVAGRAQQSFAGHNRHYLSAYLRTVHSYALYFPILTLVSNLSMMIILFYGHYALGMTVKVGEIFAFFAYINMFFMPLRQLAEKFNMFQSAMAAAERVFRLLDEPVSIRNQPAAVTVSQLVNGEIEFRNVEFSYNPDSPILKDLSFRIRPGERVALVGHTGSGKTTIISLLNRLYDIQSGSILLDSQDIRRYDLHDLRHQIATVPQDVFLFTGKLGENISLFQPEISSQDIETAARQVHLDRFIRMLPLGYDQNVLEEGKLLSAGQKQLLSFARALVRRPAIIILDEATANVDSATEQLIEDAIQNLLKGRTAIIIAHRLSTIRAVDRILVLDHGRLVEEGNHETLMSRRGVYHDLYQMQAFLSN